MYTKDQIKTEQYKAFTSSNQLFCKLQKNTKGNAQYLLCIAALIILTFNEKFLYLH